MGPPSISSQREEDVPPRVLDPRVSEALDFMAANLHDCSLTVADVAAQAGLSRSGFSRLFRLGTGSGPGQMLMRMRMQIAGELLSTKRGLRVKQVAARVGFLRSEGFARTFRRWHGMTPSEFRSSRR
jgi:two-component system response regulator YesN